MPEVFEDCPKCAERFEVVIGSQDEYHTKCPYCQQPLRLQRVEYVVADEIDKEEMDPDVTLIARKRTPPEPKPKALKGRKRR